MGQMTGRYTPGSAPIPAASFQSFAHQKFSFIYITVLCTSDYEYREESIHKAAVHMDLTVKFTPILFFCYSIRIWTF